MYDSGFWGDAWQEARRRSGSQVEQKIYDFLPARAVHGEYEDVNDSVIAVMWWKVKNSV